MPPESHNDDVRDWANERLERLGYWRHEIDNDALRILADEGASLVVKISGSGAVECTAPYLEKELAKHERVQFVKGIGGVSDDEV